MDKHKVFSDDWLGLSLTRAQKMLIFEFIHDEVLDSLDGQKDVDDMRDDAFDVYNQLRCSKTH